MVAERLWHHYSHYCRRLVPDNYTTQLIVEYKYIVDNFVQKTYIKQSNGGVSKETTTTTHLAVVPSKMGGKGSFFASPTIVLFDLGLLEKVAHNVLVLHYKLCGMVVRHQSSAVVAVVVPPPLRYHAKVSSQ